MHMVADLNYGRMCFTFGGGDLKTAEDLVWEDGYTASQVKGTDFLMFIGTHNQPSIHDFFFFLGWVNQ